MGSAGVIAFGLALMVGAVLLMQHVRPRANRPTPAWAQSDGMSTIVALVIVIALVMGFSMVLASVLG